MSTPDIPAHPPQWNDEDGFYCWWDHDVPTGQVCRAVHGLIVVQFTPAKPIPAGTHVFIHAISASWPLDDCELHVQLLDKRWIDGQPEPAAPTKEGNNS